jgi:glycosyltransferase involved in cell wall biosynthesis
MAPVEVLQQPVRKPTVLALLGAFWPGSASSGPNQSFKGMAASLSADFEFCQISRDRPFGAARPLVESGKWFDQGYARARYCAPGRFGAQGLAEALRDTEHDVLLLNGFYDQEFTLPALLLRRSGRVPRKPVILSPRGEFAQGAMGLKPARKSAWRTFARRARLLDDVILHATSEQELHDIRSGYPWAGGYVVAPIIRPLVEALPHTAGPPGICRLVFVGRISPVKNLDYALSALARVTTHATLDIYGPVQDAPYWERCQALIASLPENVTVTHRGEIANEDAPRALAKADLLFLPTMGENFGHAIFEALSCCVPVLISNTTPWRDLEQQSAGWDLPLAEPLAFARTIDTFASLSQERQTALRVGARALAEHWVHDSPSRAETKAMFLSALSKGLRPTFKALSKFPSF